MKTKHNLEVRFAMVTAMTDGFIYLLFFFSLLSSQMDTITENDESITERIQKLQYLINHTSVNLIKEMEDDETRYGRQYRERKYETLINIIR